MACPDVRTDLKREGWTGIESAEIVTAVDGQARAHRREYRRGERALVLWFTGPYAIAKAYSPELGWLVDPGEIRAVVGADPSTPIDPTIMHPRCRAGYWAGFISSMDRLAHLIDRDEGSEVA